MKLWPVNSVFSRGDLGRGAVVGTIFLLVVLKAGVQITHRTFPSLTSSMIPVKTLIWKNRLHGAFCKCILSQSYFRRMF